MSTLTTGFPVEKKTRLCYSFFLPKSPGGHAIYHKNARVLEMRNFTPAYMKGCTYVRTILSEPKFLGCIDNQIFLLMVPHRARAPLKKNLVSNSKCPDSFGHGTWVYTRDWFTWETGNGKGIERGLFNMCELGRVPLSSACSNLSMIVCSKRKFRGLDGKNIEKR